MRENTRSNKIISERKPENKEEIMKKKIVAIALLALCIAAIFAFAACDNNEGSSDVVITEDDTFKTEDKAIWVFVGNAYLAFEKVPEPAQPVEGELYGNVFKVYATSDGNPHTPWLTGTWDLEITDGKPGTLTITAEWPEGGENITALSDAVSGQPKTYEPNEDGVYEIKVDFPSASGLTFKLDPATDKVTA